MKLAAAFSILLDLRLAVQLTFMPIIRALIHSPSLFFRPTALSRLFMAKLWVPFGDGADENGRPVKEQLITPNAYGVVVDIGAGCGHTIKYLDRSRVVKYVALEPNIFMHSTLRSAANAAGFNESDGTLLILSCGAEDTASIVSSIGAQSVDTFISILTLCTIPSPEEVLRSVIGNILKPGGQLLFYEHVLSRRDDVAWWQRFWTPLWSLVFGGCRLDCPTDIWLEKMVTDHNGESMWSEKGIWGKEEEPEEHLFWHRVGKLIKQ